MKRILLLSSFYQRRTETQTERLMQLGRPSLLHCLSVGRDGQVMGGLCKGAVCSVSPESSERGPVM